MVDLNASINNLINWEKLYLPWKILSIKTSYQKDWWNSQRRSALLLRSCSEERNDIASVHAINPPAILSAQYRIIKSVLRLEEQWERDSGSVARRGAWHRPATWTERLAGTLAAWTLKERDQSLLLLSMTGKRRMRQDNIREGMASTRRLLPGHLAADI